VRNILVLLAGFIAVASLLSGGVATADNRTALACYDTAKAYTSVVGHKHHPRGFPGGAWHTTTSSCSDINVKSDRVRSIRVCFDPSSGDPICQENYTSVGTGWTVVATKVADGTKFKLNFKDDRNGSGYFAA